MLTILYDTVLYQLCMSFGQLLDLENFELILAVLTAEEHAAAVARLVGEWMS